MNRSLWIRSLLVMIAIAMLLSLFACNDGTGEGTDVPETEGQTESENVTGSESETSSEAESDTGSGDFDPDDAIYANGGDVESAGHNIEEDAFALVERSYDKSLAVEKTADEIKAMLVDKASMTEGAVYLVKEPIVLDSNTKYFGN